MNEKSHVSLEQHVCLVCGAAFDTGNLLLDKRLRPTLDRHTVTRWGLCTKHQQLNDAGYIALVECDPERSGIGSGTESLKPGEAYRTGTIAHIPREVFSAIFNVKLTADDPCVFVPTGAVDLIRSKCSSH